MSGIRGRLGIVRRSLRQHALSTAVTALSLALASGLVMAVFQIEHQARLAFTGGASGFDAILGARGSPLQLVLNTVYHLESSPGNVPWSMYEELRDDPRVELAVPYVLGDSYRGFRVVGTTEELFTELEVRRNRKLALREPGRVFDPTLREAVIGSYVAQRTGLRVGAHFEPSHGLSGDGEEHDEEYVVVGVLEPTNGPIDRVIWIPIDGMFHMEGHVFFGTGEEFVPDPDVPIPDEHKEVSAVMLKLKGGFGVGSTLAQELNREDGRATLAYPIAQYMAQLFDKLGWMTRVLTLVAYLVVAVAAGSVLASIYNTMNERRREFAILRALGARRSTVFSVIVLESAAIAFLGALLGLVVYAGIFYGAAALIRSQTGVVLDLFALHPALGWTPLGIVVLGALTGVLPALKAYRTDVAEHLVPTS